MKCQNCGHDNPASTAFCEECGELLSHKLNARAATGAWGFIRENEGEIVDNLSDGELDFDKEDIDELEKKFMEGVEDWAAMPGNKPVRKPEKPAAPAKPEPAAPAAPQRRSLFDEADRFAEGAKSSAKAGADEAVDELDAFEPQPVRRRQQPAQQRSQQASAQRPERRSKEPARRLESRNNGEDTGAKSKRGIIPIIIVGVLLLALIGGIVWYLMNNKDSGANGENAKTEINVDPNDPNKYNITVHEKEGTVLVFETSAGNQTEHTVSHKNYIIFNVGKAELLPVEPIETNPCEVTPKIYIKGADGELTPIKFDPVEINAPEISVTFNKSDEFKAEEGVAELTGRIDNPAQYGAEITVNGEKVNIDANGGFAYSTKFDMEGSYPLEFIAKLNGYVIYKKTFTVGVDKTLTPEEVIIIPEGIENYTRLSNADEFISVSGNVPKGSQLSVVSSDPDFSLRGEPELDENGKFNFTVNMPVAGKAYPFTIVVTTPSGTEYRREYSVERPPVYTEYVQRCWAENYDEMSKPARAESKQPFRFKCTVTEIVYDGDYLIVRATLSTDPSKTIEIEYHDHYASASNLEAGEAYMMSGYPLGIDEEGMLRMYVWFVDDKH